MSDRREGTGGRVMPPSRRPATRSGRLASRDRAHTGKRIASGPPLKSLGPVEPAKLIESIGPIEPIKLPAPPRPRTYFPMPRRRRRRGTLPLAATPMLPADRHPRGGRVGQPLRGGFRGQGL
jgi:hypothetical protein